MQACQYRVCTGRPARCCMRRIIQVLRRTEYEVDGIVTRMYAFKMSEAYERRRGCFCS